MSYRKISRVFKGEDKKEGAGVKIRRIFDRETIREMDPFLMMDFFDTENPEDYRGGFPWHPHRGIETITYIINGEVYHEDTLGNKGSIMDGECQWMISANGIMHQEMMLESKELLGVQIWLNMKSKEKMKNPSYFDLRYEDIGRVEEDSYKVNILSGEFRGVKGVVERNDEIRPRILDVRLKEGEEFIFSEEKFRTVFIFTLRGYLDLGGRLLVKGEGALYERDSKDRIKVIALEESRFLVLSGNPIKEDVYWEGPIVMNSKEELDRAFDELKRQEFISYRG